MERNIKMNVNYPTPEQFIAALGKPHDSLEVELLFNAFGIVWDDVEKYDKDLETRIYQSDELGIGFTFEDEGGILKKPYHDMGDGPFVLTDCAFWGFNDETKMYKGPLISGIEFTDSIEQAEKILGASTQKKIAPNRPFFWHLDDNKTRITIQWPTPNKARVVTYWLLTPGMLNDN